MTEQFANVKQKVPKTGYVVLVGGLVRTWVMFGYTIQLHSNPGFYFGSKLLFEQMTDL